MGSKKLFFILYSFDRIIKLCHLLFKVKVKGQTYCFIISIKYMIKLNSAVYWKRKDCTSTGRAIRYGSNLPSLKKEDNHDEDEVQCTVEEFKKTN